MDNFPNLFSVFSPQGPGFVNGPTCVEVQGSWVVQTIDYLRQHCITKITPTSNAAVSYKRHIDIIFNATTFLPLMKGDCNAPGEKCEVYHYVGGLPVYKQEITEETEQGYPGFQRSAKDLAFESGKVKVGLQRLLDGRCSIYSPWTSGLVRVVVPLHLLGPIRKCDYLQKCTRCRNTFSLINKGCPQCARELKVNVIL